MTEKEIVDLFAKIEQFTLVFWIACSIVMTFLPRRVESKSVETDNKTSEEEEYQKYLISHVRLKRIKFSFILVVVTLVVVLARYFVEKIYGDGGDVIFVLLLLLVTWSDHHAYRKLKKALSEQK